MFVENIERDFDETLIHANPSGYWQAVNNPIDEDFGSGKATWIGFLGAALYEITVWAPDYCDDECDARACIVRRQGHKATLKAKEKALVREHQVFIASQAINTLMHDVTLRVIVQVLVNRVMWLIKHRYRQRRNRLVAWLKTLGRRTTTHPNGG